MANLKNEVTKEVETSMEMFSPENMDRLTNALGKSLRKFLDEKREKAIDLRDQYEGTIKEHPFSCVATGFIGGLIIGLLLRKH